MDKGNGWKETRQLYARLDSTECMREFYNKSKPLVGKARGGLRSFRHAILRYFGRNGLDPDQWLSEVRSGKRSVETEFTTYLRTLADSGEFGANTIQSYRTALLNFAEGLKLGPIDLPPTGQITNVREQEPFTPQEMQTMANVAGQRERMILLFAMASGARVGEIAGLKVKDFSELDERKEEPYCLLIPKVIAKGGVERHAYFTEEAANSIRAYVKSRNLNPEDRVFASKRSLERIFRNLIKRAGLEKPENRTFHMLRKYCKTALLQYMDEGWAELLIGHGQGTLAKKYDLPTKELLRTYYTRALPGLCVYSHVNGRIPILQAEVADLKNQLRYADDRKLDDLISALEEIKKERAKTPGKIAMGMIQGLQDNIPTGGTDDLVDQLLVKLKSKRKSEQPEPPLISEDVREDIKDIMDLRP